LGAYRALKKYGGVGGILTHLGFEEIAIGHAKRGDLVIYRDERLGETMGLMLNTSALFSGNKELPRSMLTRAFRLKGNT
jgi:hypothetical protein